MKLYTDGIGNWLGTQADAKREMGEGGYTLVEVPTDKPNLLRFLNDRDVCTEDESFGHGSQDEPIDLSEINYPGDTPFIAERHPQSCSTNPNRWEVHDAVLNCDRNHLGAALGAIISRIHDEMEDV